MVFSKLASTSFILPKYYLLSVPFLTALFHIAHLYFQPSYFLPLLYLFP